jgi:hypothetical protein
MHLFFALVFLKIKSSEVIKLLIYCDNLMNIYSCQPMFYCLLEGTASDHFMH